MVDGDGLFRHQLFSDGTVLAHQQSYAMAQRLEFSGAQLTGPVLTAHQGHEGLGRIYSQAPAVPFPLEGCRTRPTVRG